MFAKFSSFIQQKINTLLENTAWNEKGFHPWRRFLARMLDLIIGTFLAIGLIGAIFGGLVLVCDYFAPFQIDNLLSPETAQTITAFFESFIGQVLDIILTSFLATLVTALILGLTGSTIGKWIFGIKVRDADNNKLNVKAAIKREMNVYIGGLALAIPIISLCALAHSYSRLKQKGKTIWDDQGNFIVYYHNPNWKQCIFNVIGFLLFIYGYVVIRSL